MTYFFCFKSVVVLYSSPHKTQRQLTKSRKCKIAENEIEIITCFKTVLCKNIEIGNDRIIIH